jgi:3-oxoacyl-[acyl-carrier-protein] synthase II
MSDASRSGHAAAAQSQRESDDRVVISGLGAVTPYGLGVDAFWEGLLSGQPTARTIQRFDPAGHDVRFACEVPDFDPFAVLPRKLVRQLDPFAQFALVATAEALGDAGLLASDSEPTSAELPLAAGIDPERVGVLIASGIGGLQETTDQHQRLLTHGPDRVRPYLTIAMPLNMASGQAAIRHGLQGPSYSVVSACASATDGIGAALDLVRAGRADVVVAGGSEAAINPLTVAGFARAGALSGRNGEPHRASRPFDADRDGFVLGEGAGVVVVERAGHAHARGAEPIAELAGYGPSNDAYNTTLPPADGRGAARALRSALADAGIEPTELDHINAHGTSTPSNDAAEAAAVRAVLGEHAEDVTVTSTKSAVGHLLGAAGGVEAVATTRAMREGLVPASQNLEHQDQACPLDVVAGDPRKQAIRAAASHSFGFGGHNAVLVLRALDGDNPGGSRD